MNEFGMGEIVPLRSARTKEDRRAAMEAKIAEKLSTVKGFEDTSERIANIEHRLVKETSLSDRDREELEIERAAFLRYREAINLPESLSSMSLHSLQDGPGRLAEPWKEKMYPDILTADAMKVRRYEAPDELKLSKKEETPSEPVVLVQRHIGTAVNIKRSAPPEFAEGQSDVGQAAK